MRIISSYSIIVCAVIALAAFGCSESPQVVEPSGHNTTTHSTNTSLFSVSGDEMLGDIDIPIADGSGVVIGGVGLVGEVAVVQPGTININVPGTPKQVLLYWCGHNLEEGTDTDVTVNGMPVSGTVVGGPTLFFPGAWSSTVRADITSMNLISSGANAIQVGGLDFTLTCPYLCQNLGAGLLVVYDDGSQADIMIKDGNDNAFYDFDPPLDTTAPVTYNFAASSEARVADLCMFAASVSQFPSDGGRPNVVEVTVGATVTRFVDVFQGYSGNDFDAVCVQVDIPAGATSMTVQALSEKDPSSQYTGIPASLTWMVSAVSIASVPEPELAEIGDRVWCDYNMDGIQDENEPGKPNITVSLYDCSDQFIGSMMTDAAGYYKFTDLPAGDYYVCFDLPDGYVFSPQNQGGNDAVDSDADETTGCTVCTTLDEGESDLTWDAGMYEEPVIEGEGCTPGYWKNHPLAWAATGYDPETDLFDDVFGCEVFGYDITLLEALEHGGGKVYRLGRHGAAALLSAAHPNVYYNLTVEEVIDLVCEGDADALEYENEMGCPLDKQGDRNVDDNDDDNDNYDRAGKINN